MVESLSISPLKIIKMKRVKAIPTAIGHPPGNPPKRKNCTFKPIICVFISKDQMSWDKHLGEFQLMYNSSYHASFRMSPYYLGHRKNNGFSVK